MSECERIDSYLDGVLKEPELGSFLRHVATCADCGVRVRKWQLAKERLVTWANETGLRPDADVRRALVVTARGKTRRRRTVWRWRYAAAAMTAALLVAVPVWRRLQAPASLPEQEAVWEGPATLALVLNAPDGQGKAVQVAPPLAVGYRLEAHESPLRVDIGDDRFVLLMGGAATVRGANARHTLLDLDTGRVLVSAHREQGRTLEVRTGQQIVRVTGTLFAVTATLDDCPVVEVKEGSVLVLSAGGENHLEAGEALDCSEGEVTIRALGAETAQELVEAFAPLASASSHPSTEAAAAATSAPSRAPRQSLPVVSAALDLTALQALVVEGRYADAEAVLQRLVALEPQNSEAWSLLGDCLRKLGRWHDSVTAYARVVELHDSVLSERARLLAADILSERVGDHAGAVRLLEPYARGQGAAPELANDARISLARSLHALGEEERAKALLELVVSEGAGTPHAERAGRLLRSWKASLP